MSIKTYNKLVRDRIPEIILSNGSIPKTRVLNDKEYSKYLRKKLLEEINEFLSKEKDDIEELADLYEIVLAILKNNNVTLEQFENIRCQKALERGRFENRILLLTVNE